MLGDCPCPDHTANIRGYHDEVFVLALEDVCDQYRRTVDVVHGALEKALYLLGMQVDGQYTVDAHGHHHVSDDLGANRYSRGPHPAILAGVAEVGHHRGDAGGRGPTQRVDHDNQFHQVVVSWCAGGLQDENILAADIFIQLNGSFAVTEAADIRLAQGEVQATGHLLRQFRVGVTREYHHF